MIKYRCLDLYCCGGGASLGYEQAGFEAVGVDIEKQPHYRGKFIQADVLEFMMDRDNWRTFDFIHASPPCQLYSKTTKQFKLKGKEYPDLVEPTRKLLQLTGLPYVIENVEGAPLIDPILLCGSMFDIPAYRHRLFESNIPLTAPEHKKHIHRVAEMGRMPKEGEFITYVGHFAGVKMVQDFTGLHWLNQKELAQSIPPQYTEYIGKQIIKYLNYGS